MSDADRLPLHQSALLGAAVGRTLDDIERILATTPEDFEARGGAPDGFFAEASGPTEITFSGGLVHALAGRASELSVIVGPDRFGPDPYAERYRLTDGPVAAHAPAWLAELVGATVTDVRVWLYRDDVPSDEARQAAVSYVLEGGDELFYGTYLHGRMSGDELFRRQDLDPDVSAGPVSVAVG